MLFRNYETINYTIGNRTVSLVDIFRNVVFANADTSLAFDDYYIDDGETPESVSAKMYGTTSFSWLILLVNNILDIQKDWFVSASDFKAQQERDFGGESFYIPALPDLQVGDILVKVTATAADNLTAENISIQDYRHIAEFDPYFRKIRGISGSGTIETGDLILFARQDTSNGTVNPILFLNQEGTPKTTNYTNVIFKEPHAQSVVYFYNSNNVVIDPYRVSPTGATSINANTLYTNSDDTLTPNNFAFSILYKYGISGGDDYLRSNNLIKMTVAEEEYTKYLKKQKIRVLKKDYLAPVVNSLESALQSNAVGRRLRIEI